MSTHSNVSKKIQDRINDCIRKMASEDEDEDCDMKSYCSSTLFNISEMQDNLVRSGRRTSTKIKNMKNVPFAQLSNPVRNILSKHFEQVRKENWRKKKEEEVEEILRINKRWKSMKSNTNGKKLQYLRDRKLRERLKDSQFMVKVRNEIPQKCQRKASLKKIKKVQFVRRKKKNRRNRENDLRRSMSQNDILKLKNVHHDKFRYLKDQYRKKRSEERERRKENERPRRIKSAKPEPKNYDLNLNPISNKKKDNHNRMKVLKRSKSMRFPKRKRGGFSSVSTGPNYVAKKRNDFADLRKNMEPNVESNIPSKFPLINKYPTFFK